MGEDDCFGACSCFTWLFGTANVATSPVQVTLRSMSGKEVCAEAASISELRRAARQLGLSGSAGLALSCGDHLLDVGTAITCVAGQIVDVIAIQILSVNVLELAGKDAWSFGEEPAANTALLAFGTEHLSLDNLSFDALRSSFHSGDAVSLSLRRQHEVLAAFALPGKVIRPKASELVMSQDSLFGGTVAGAGASRAMLSIFSPRAYPHGNGRNMGLVYTVPPKDAAFTEVYMPAPVGMMGGLLPVSPLSDRRLALDDIELMGNSVMSLVVDQNRQLESQPIDLLRIPTQFLRRVNAIEAFLRGLQTACGAEAPMVELICAAEAFEFVSASVESWRADVGNRIHYDIPNNANADRIVATQS